MIDFLLDGTTNSTATITNLLLGMSIAFAIGCIISITNIKTSKVVPRQGFLITLIIIPLTIFLIIYLIGNNVATAFSLAGAFSIVRFRSEPGDPKDIAYIFFAMAGGLACGLNFYIYAIIFTIILCLLMTILNIIKFGESRDSNKILKIVIPEDFDFEGIFDDLLKEYTSSYQLVRVKTIDLGSLYEIMYYISIDHKHSQKEFIDEIRCRNGNLNVTLTLNRDLN